MTSIVDYQLKEETIKRLHHLAFALLAAHRHFPRIRHSLERFERLEQKQTGQGDKHGCQRPELQEF